MPIDRLELDKPNFTYRREGETEFVMEHVGEIRFGPPYCALWFRVRGQPEGRFAGPDRHALFGELTQLSHGGRYCVAEQWHDFKSPDTTAIIIDTWLRRGAVLVHIGSGFIRRIEFEPDDGVTEIRSVTLDLDVFGNKELETRQIAMPTEWSPLDWWPG